MDWLHPTYGLALVAVPVAVWLYWRAARLRRRSREQFGDATIVGRLLTALRPYRRTVKSVLVVVAIALLGVALAGPRFGTKVRTVERRGVDLVVALDVSASMRAGDVAPSRLRRAKAEIRDLVDRLSGDRVGLVVFAGEGVVQCPLTADYAAFSTFLDVAGPDQVPVPGTDLSAAFDLALRAFDSAAPGADTTAIDDARPRALLVVSDGENHVGDLDALRRRAAEASVTLLTAGVGTEEGARVPDYRNGEQVGFKRNDQGQLVTSTLHEDALVRLAQSGAYFRIGSATSALADVPVALRQLGSGSYGEEQFAAYEEQYQWPLALALVLLFVEAVIPVRVRSTARRRTIRVPENDTG